VSRLWMNPVPTHNALELAIELVSKTALPRGLVRASPDQEPKDETERGKIFS
jgi:hypothetical protein